MTTQDTPIEHGFDDADDAARADGIVAQCRADLALGTTESPTDMLRLRLDQAGVVVTDAEFDALLDRLEH
jgi:hypothetical protein